MTVTLRMIEVGLARVQCGDERMSRAVRPLPSVEEDVWLLSCLVISFRRIYQLFAAVVRSCSCAELGVTAKFGFKWTDLSDANVISDDISVRSYAQLLANSYNTLLESVGRTLESDGRERERERESGGERESGERRRGVMLREEERRRCLILSKRLFRLYCHIFYKHYAVIDLLSLAESFLFFGRFLFYYSCHTGSLTPPIDWLHEELARRIIDPGDSSAFGSISSRVSVFVGGSTSPSIFLLKNEK